MTCPKIELSENKQKERKPQTHCTIQSFFFKAEMQRALLCTKGGCCRFPCRAKRAVPRVTSPAPRQRFSQRGTDGAIIIALTGSSLNRSGGPSRRVSLLCIPATLTHVFPALVQPLSGRLAFSFRSASSENTGARGSGRPLSAL